MEAKWRKWIILLAALPSPKWLDASGNVLRHPLGVLVPKGIRHEYCVSARHELVYRVLRAERGDQNRAAASVA